MTNQEKALELHEKLQGKLETVSKTPVRTREDLALVYTPGVAEPCKVIAKDPAAAYTYTMKANTVAVVSDGSAVLGLGNIGPKAAMPVMEGKAVLFKEFGGVNAVPICLDTQDTEEIIKAVTWLAPAFGGGKFSFSQAPLFQGFGSLRPPSFCQYNIPRQSAAVTESRRRFYRCVLQSNNRRRNLSALIGSRLYGLR